MAFLILRELLKKPSHVIVIKDEMLNHSGGGCVGILGLVKVSEDITDTAFDILSLEALLLVPRCAPCNTMTGGGFLGLYRAIANVARHLPLQDLLATFPEPLFRYF